MADDAWCGVLRGGGRARPRAVACGARRDPGRVARAQLAEQVDLALLDRFDDDGGMRRLWCRARGCVPPDPIDLLEDPLARDPHSDRAVHDASRRATSIARRPQIAFGRAVADASWQVTLATRQRAAEAGAQPFEIRREDMESGRMPAHAPAERACGSATHRRSRTPTACTGARTCRAGHLTPWGCPALLAASLGCAGRWASLRRPRIALVREAARIDPANSLAPVYGCNPALHLPLILHRRPPQNRRAPVRGTQCAGRSAR